MVSAPGTDGRLGILPSHAPLLASLRPGELRLQPRDDDEEISIAIGGGFIEVSKDRVIVLAHSAERATEIDTQRAVEARARALDRLQSRGHDVDTARARAAMERAEARLRVAERYRRARANEGR
jgi:F-type H+-transporting ATPase subunit epsilon